jgi:hypothetical protein
MTDAVFDDSDVTCPDCVAEGKTTGVRQGRYLREHGTGKLWCPFHGTREDA